MNVQAITTTTQSWLEYFSSLLVAEALYHRTYHTVQ